MDSYAELSEALLANQLERVDELCRRELVKLPGDAEMLTLSGALARSKGDPEGALECFARAAELSPAVPQFRNNLGVILGELGRHQEAVKNYREALSLKPDYWEARCNLGNALQALGRTDEAIRQYRETLAMDPTHADAQYNLANVLRGEGRLQEALESYRRLVAISPRRLSGWINLGATLHALGFVEEAIEAQRKALRIDPDSADAHWNLALSLLAIGDYRNGWREYQWRLGGERFPATAAGKPMWDGTPLAGRTLLLRSEQGFGDTLQFYRYAALLAREGVRVLLECRAELLPLFSRQKEGIRCFACGEEPPPFDTFAYLMSLPFLLGSTLSNLPAQVPYLEADPPLKTAWERVVGGSGRCKVGLVWAGSAGYCNDRSRSLPLHLLAPLASIPGVELYSLQIGAAAAGLHAEPWGRGVHDLSGALSDFSVTAAVIANLDLVVSVDTAVAHLAGALGKPVCLMLASPAEWRWLRERSDSPWYPTMRLYRQENPGEWGAVIAAIARDLRWQQPQLEAGFRKANSLRQEGRYTEAISAYRELLALRPECAEVHNNLGMAQQELGDREEALRSYRRAIALDPQSAHALNNIGTVLASRGDHQAALQCFRKGVELDENCVAACLNLGSSLQHLGQPEQALPLYARVLELEPSSVEARVKLGTLYRDLMQPEQAIPLFEEALGLDPRHGEAHGNLALALLSIGNFGRGWRELEWRFAGEVAAGRGKPRWEGEAAAGLTILLACDQEEDTLQFIRFAAMVAARGATVVVECQSPSLKPLLQRTPGVASVCAKGEPVPHFDLWAPLLSLPGIFGARLDWLPVAPYLMPDPLKVTFWRKEIAAARELKVGVVWRGDQSELDPLWELKGIRWHTLDLQEKPDPPLSPLSGLPAQLEDLEDLAAVMANLDLVLTHDAAAAHLAGGMGVPVWTLLSYACDWRWLCGRDDSPWYPSMRLFRQERHGEWREVVLRVAGALEQLARQREGVVR